MEGLRRDVLFKVELKLWFLSHLFLLDHMFAWSEFRCPLILVPFDIRVLMKFVLLHLVFLNMSESLNKRPQLVQLEC